MKGIEQIKKDCGKVTATLLSKQCRIIKVNPKKIDFSKPDWYVGYTWTAKQEKTYKKWFINYLYGNLKRTKEVAKYAHIVYKSKKMLNKLYLWWSLDYGWKVEGR